MLRVGGHDDPYGSSHLLGDGEPILVVGVSRRQVSVRRAGDLRAADGDGTVAGPGLEAGDVCFGGACAGQDDDRDERDERGRTDEGPRGHAQPAGTCAHGISIPESARSDRANRARDPGNLSSDVTDDRPASLTRSRGCLHWVVGSSVRGRRCATETRAWAVPSWSRASGAGPRASSLVDSHAHDGRFGLPGHDMVFSVAPATRLRCSVDGKRARQRGRCRFEVGDVRLREALRRAAETAGSSPGTGETAEP